MEHTIIYETPIHFVDWNNIPLCKLEDWHYGTSTRKNVTCESCKAKLPLYTPVEESIKFLQDFLKNIMLANFVIRSIEVKPELNEFRDSLGILQLVLTGHRTLTIKYVDKQ